MASPVLSPGQLQHAQRILEILQLQKRPGYIDQSTFGAGKKYAACYVAQQLKLALLVVCENSYDARSWEKISGQFSISWVQIITRTTLTHKTGTKTLLPSHDLLIRQTVYQPTSSYLKHVASGLLLIFSCQVYNHRDTDSFAAFRKLATPICKTLGPSRLGLFLTKPRRFRGVYSILELGRYASKTCNTSSRDLVQRCKIINPGETENILRSKKRGTTLVWTLVSRVLFPSSAISFSGHDVEEDMCYIFGTQPFL